MTKKVAPALTVLCFLIAAVVMPWSLRARAAQISVGNQGSTQGSVIKTEVEQRFSQTGYQWLPGPLSQGEVLTFKDSASGSEILCFKANGFDQFGSHPTMSCLLSGRKLK